MPIYGITTTIGWFVYVVMSFQISPRDIAGFLTGTRTAIRVAGKAMICLLIGIFWNYLNHSWFWYFQILSYILAMISSLIVVVCETFRTNKL